MPKLVRTARGGLLTVWAIAVSCAAVPAPAVAAQAAESWLDPMLADAAKKEGSVVIYSSVNEEEALPIWKVFEQKTGIKIEYIRGSDSQMIGRILIENRGGQRSWDLVLVTSVQRLPQQLLAPVEPPEAAHLFPAARDPGKRFYGFAANYDVPAYNSKFINPTDLPKTYEEFAKKSEWAGHAVINESDSEWMIALLDYFGDAKGREIIGNLAATLKPAIVSGHLAVARAVGAGEYWVALNNYANLTVNVKLAGAPTDIFLLDPIGVFYQQAGINVTAPHPNAARLASNFLLSQEGQRLLTQRGRIPARPDVETNPPGVLTAIQARKVIPSVFNPEKEKKAEALFKELMVGRPR